MVPREVKFPGATLLITSEAIHVLSLFPMPALSHAVLHWMGCTASASLCSWGQKFMIIIVKAFIHLLSFLDEARL